MNTFEFLSQLRRLDVLIWADGDRLRCRAPKGTLTPALRAELAERKAEILAFLHQANLASRSTLESIRPIPRDGDLPLSFAQARLWFLDQLEGQSAAYNLPAALCINGPLHVAALEKSLTEIVRRHEVLRSTFPMVNGVPVQVIASTLTVTLPMLDLQNLPEVEQSLTVQRLAREEAQRPFDLANGPLLRVSLLWLGKEEHVLLLTMHHIVSDGWSIGIFIREVAALYEAFCTGASPALPELPIQYADFAVFQRQWLQGEVLDEQFSYWKQQLANAPSLLQLPTDRPRPPVQTFCGDVECFQLSPDLTKHLKTLSQQSGATLYMTLLSAFATLLSRDSGQQDLVIGSPIANRNRRETESLIGFLVNTLALRIDMSGNPTFLELLSRVKKLTLDAFAHQDLPFEKLVEELRPERNLSHHPLFQVMFVLQNAPMEKLELPGLALTLLEREHITATFDLTLTMEETEQGLSGELEYNTDLFDAATIQRLAGHFQTLLEGIVADPQRCISELPLLTEIERHQMLVEWNNTQAEYPQDRCLHQLFEAQVERTPEAVAVVFEAQQLTYRQLNAKANQLAHHLIALGVGPEMLVGLCVERSIEMVVGLLGILKAGGAYVPLDPSYPKARIAFMIEETKTPVLLTEACLVEKLPQQSTEVICLDDNWESIAVEGEGNPIGRAKPEDLAYVIYTSGSTGQSKGVTIQHRSLVNYIWWAKKQYLQGRRLDVPLYSSFACDLTITSVFVPLISGSKIVVYDADEDAGDLAILQVVEDDAVDVIKLTPSHLSLVKDMIGGTSKLKKLILGGEDLKTDLAKEITNVRCTIEIYNEYGPTEATVGCMIHRFNPEKDRATSVPIGKPVANTRIYLLDRHLHPVPASVVGEIYISGDGVARGYLNRPDLTEARFLPNPFAPNQKMYRTGDLARWTTDGQMEFLGRRDHQVKIRGFRIELGEIETVLQEHPAVGAVIVLAREEAGNKHLVAYVVPEREQVPNVSELNRFLKAKLPNYMVPQAFVMLEEMPRTPNGKVDRQALPAPETSRSGLETAYVAPSTPTEEVLASIWADVLGLEQVGIHDNFFELGGHSLQAMQLISKVSAAMNLEIPVRLLFLHPTIAALANALGELHQKKRESPSIRDAVQAVSFEEFKTPPSSPFFQLEGRSLLSLFAAGKVAPVDAAALGYLPDSILEHTGLSRDEVIHDWCENLPVWYSLLETHWGRIAVLLLPRFRSELYRDGADLVDVIVEALEMAGRVGARTVSLTGLIPSATDYGDAIAKAIAGRKGLPMISTGHATTSATVVLAIKRILQEGGRDLAYERAGFIGLGSVGMSTLRLMLRCLPHPMAITLCDVYSQLDFLEEVQREIVRDFGFRGDVRVIVSQAVVPPEIYDATLIIGATNVPDILDITRVKPGTLMVDDSAPHCFAPELAVKRFQEQGDLLLTEGGVLRSPHPIRERRYVPRHVEQVLRSAGVEAFSEPPNPYQITGCVFSSLLSSCFDVLVPTLGIVDGETCLGHYERLGQLGFQAADLHCEGYVLPEKSIQNFRSRFGKS